MALKSSEVPSSKHHSVALGFNKSTLGSGIMQSRVVGRLPVKCESSVICM